MDAGKVAGIDWASEVHVACVMYGIGREQTTSNMSPLVSRSAGRSRTVSTAVEPVS